MEHLIGFFSVSEVSAHNELTVINLEVPANLAAKKTEPANKSIVSTLSKTRVLNAITLGTLERHKPSDTIGSLKRL